MPASSRWYEEWDPQGQTVNPKHLLLVVLVSSYCTGATLNRYDILLVVSQSYTFTVLVRWYY
jgi:hypothetical protein